MCNEWATILCLTADTCLTADPGVASSFQARYHTFGEIDHEIISIATCLPFADSSRVVISYKGKNVHKALVNDLVKLAQETDCPDTTIAVESNVKHQNKQAERKQSGS